MARIIAIAGKGGTGKTTLAALLVRAFQRRSIRPILAVDADPNSNLPDKLGMKVSSTIGDLREDTMGADFRAATGVSKTERIEYAVQQAIAEGKGCDLLVMGRPEGPGCYCFVNELLRQSMRKISSGYQRVVIDNEAGMEHMSRRTDGKVDVLLITSDETPVGMRAARAIHALANKLGLKAPACYLILTRATGRCPQPLLRDLESDGLRLGGETPDDDLVAQFALADRPIVGLPDDSPAVLAAERIVDALAL